MDQATHNKIVSFIWGIAGDGLRNLFMHLNCPDVTLPTCILRRMDAVNGRNARPELHAC
jgi:type I restriction enzyme M protein